MKTIKTSNNDKNKEVKKMLVNRSRSNNLLPVNNRQDCYSPKFNTKLSNYVFGFKCNGPLSTFVGPEKIKQHHILGNNNKQGQQRKLKKTEGDNLKDPHKKIYNKNLVSIFKQCSPSSANKEDNYIQEDNTTQSSKFSGENKLLIQSQYFNKGYQSPKTKLRHLSKQKNQQKLKCFIIFEKIVQTQEQIQENRNKMKTQAQLYEKIISSLKRQNKFSKSSSYFQIECNSALKQSGNFETQIGESSNQGQNFPDNLAESCSI